MSLSEGLAAMASEIGRADTVDRQAICLLLDIFGLEARNMEARLEWLASRPHTPLHRDLQQDGRR